MFVILSMTFVKYKMVWIKTGKIYNLERRKYNTYNDSHEKNSHLIHDALNGGGGECKNL